MKSSPIFPNQRVATKIVTVVFKFSFSKAILGKSLNIWASFFKKISPRPENTRFVRGSITVLLVSYLTRLDLAEQESLLLIKHKQSS